MSSDLHPPSERGTRPAAAGGQGRLPRARRSAPSTPGERSDAIGLTLLSFGLVAVMLAREPLGELFDDPAVATWATVFVSITVQAFPFLVLGVALSATLSAFVPPSVLRRALPRRPALAVPVAGASGVILPGCECASVPLAAGLMRGGIPPAAALAFMMAAPAINPVVIVATAVAFPAIPEMALARFVASLAVAVIVGWLWLRFANPNRLRLRPGAAEGAGGSRWAGMRAGAEHDLLHAGGFLVVGAMIAATVNVSLPAGLVDSLGGEFVLALLTLTLLAIVLAICSEADAFVAASMTAFPMTARLAFLVVGPVADVRLIALHVGTFGRRFAYVFVPMAIAVAVAVSVLVGEVLL
ncbi:MAG: permease [Sporichthyaceae bacterium]